MRDLLRRVPWESVFFVVIAGLFGLIMVGLGLEPAEQRHERFLAAVDACTPVTEVSDGVVNFYCTGEILEGSLRQLLSVHPDLEIAASAPIQRLNNKTVVPCRLFVGNSCQQTIGYAVAFAPRSER